MRFLNSRSENWKSKIENLKWVGLLAILVVLVGCVGMAGAQQPAKDSRIGVLGAPEEPRFSEIVAGLKKGLGELGYAPQAVQIFEVKIARADEGSAKSIVEGLLQKRIQVLFLIGSRLLKPGREASGELPIVFITPGDPVSAGLVASLARPGGNTTAMTFEYPELSGKRLELLKEMVPKIRRVLVLYDPRDPSPKQGLMAARQASPNLGLSLIEREARNREEMLQALEMLEEADAFVPIPGGFPTGYYDEITRLTNAKRRPAIFHARTASTMDALASYGANDAQIAREAARLVDKILKGTQAGELPVERPTKLELVINLKTAKQIGLTVPPNVVARADKVIK
ncbi:MAG TPA: ABC transporter substrate-binding protein [Candidatus Binatia bacterium]|jgi:putative ABC transport system substrate-binding protein|nr:ABC transporter substrate-binding protein [Candidatus Binatia bacterium]